MGEPLDANTLSFRTVGILYQLRWIEYRLLPGKQVLAGGGHRVEVRRVTVTEEYAGQRLDNFLAREMKGVPRSHLYRRRAINRQPEVSRSSR